MSGKPFVGAVVHFKKGAYCVPAIVSVIPEHDEAPDMDPIGAIVFNENGTLAPDTGWRTVRGTPESGGWHWPADHDA